MARGAPSNENHGIGREKADPIRYFENGEGSGQRKKEAFGPPPESLASSDDFPEDRSFFGTGVLDIPLKIRAITPQN